MVVLTMLASIYRNRSIWILSQN